MKNDAREPYNTCSISRIHLIKSTIANSEETKNNRPLAYTIVKCNSTTQCLDRKKEPVYRLGSDLLASYPILQVLMYPASAHVIVVKELLKLSYVSNWTATHVAY